MGYKIVMFAFDFGKHNKPHFHIVKDGKGIAVIDVYDGKILTGTLDKKFNRQFTKWYNSNKNFVIKNWELLSQGKNFISKEDFYGK